MVKTEKHINILKLKAAKTATRQSPKCSNRLKLFTEKYGYTDIQCENGGYSQSFFVQRTWCYLFLQAFAVTLKYVLWVLNQEANFQLYTEAGSSKWKLNPSTFETINPLAFWTPDVAHSASRIFQLVSAYIVGKPNSFSK